MNVRSAAAIVILFATCGPLAAAEEPKRDSQAQQASSGESADAHAAAADALLDSWKGEIEVLERARHELEAAWTLDRQNTAAFRVFEHYKVVRKQMYELQRKSRGGPKVAEVRTVLGSWHGQPEVLERAQQLLDKLALDDPYNAYAPIEAARLEMMRGYLHNRIVKNGRTVLEVGDYQPGTFERAEGTILKTRNFDPLTGDPFVMLAYIDFQRGRLDAAEQWLKQAESKGATDPTRHLFLADIYVARGKYQEAVERLERALREEGAGIKMSVHGRLASIYARTGEAEKAIASHKTLIQLDPQDPWLHGNYASYLCVYLGRNDEALKEIHTALQIMNYGVGQLTLADALYGKWADLVAEGDPDADRYFDEARRIKPDLDDVMAVRASYPAGERLASALVTKWVSIDARSRLDRSTALLNASMSGRTANVKFLLGMNANPNIANQDGWTPLLIAAFDGRTEIVDLLLAKGADTRATLDGKDAAALAEQNGYTGLAASLRKRTEGSGR